MENKGSAAADKWYTSLKAKGRFENNLACYCLEFCYGESQLRRCISRHVVADFKEAKPCTMCKEGINKLEDVNKHVNQHVLMIKRNNPFAQKVVAALQVQMRAFLELGNLNVAKHNCLICNKNLGEGATASMMLHHVYDAHPCLTVCSKCGKEFKATDKMKLALHVTYFHNDDVRDSITNHCTQVANEKRDLDSK